MPGMASRERGGLPLAWSEHLRNPPLRAAFAIGFCILFAFIGTFTFVNFVLVQPPLGVGARPAIWAALAAAGAGLPLMLTPSLPAVLAGMVLVGAGTFFAQAAATGFVSRAATGDRGSASGIYLASYFSGGLVGSAVLGQLFDRFGWAACVAGIGLALLVAALLAIRLRSPAGEGRTA